MKSLRRWHIDASGPSRLTLAANARLSSTDYIDDQVWEIALGQGETAGLALQTRYGGRAGLVSLVPMWFYEGRPIYQASAYSQAPYVSAFAPGYARLEARITPQLTLEVEYLAVESHAIGMRFTLANEGPVPATIRLELVGFVGTSGKEQKLRLRTFGNGITALMLGRVGNLEPAVVADGEAPAGDGEISTASRKLTREITLASQATVAIRAVCAGKPNPADSAAMAAKWLGADWQAGINAAIEASQAIPDIETGDEQIDLTVALAFRELQQAFLKPTASLPHASFVASRTPSRGFSRRGDGTDHDRAWSGQSPTLAYLVAPAIASSDATLAEGIVRNYLAVQQADGFIDGKPGLAGQRQGQLCLPVLARLSWAIFQYTDDAGFLRDVLAGLDRFFKRWLAADRDADGDGAPEWESEAQTGYVFWPTFADWQGWSQGADIRKVESPGLVAFLLSEARSLREIAHFLREERLAHDYDEQVTRLNEVMAGFWSPEQQRYGYRDRDTHVGAGGELIADGARGTEPLILAKELSPARRLVVHVYGGVTLRPRMIIQIEGADATGQPVTETLSSEQFTWAGARGVCTTAMVFSQVDRVIPEGLSRVYTIQVNALDTSRLDLNAVLPLWATPEPADRCERIIQLLSDPEQFWRPTGVTMTSVNDLNFDPANANGSGGVWPFWLTLVGEGLIEAGRFDLATELVSRLLKAQAIVLGEQKCFTEFYDSDSALGRGEEAHLAGIAPLHLLQRVLGVRIVSASQVWAGGPHHWPNPVTVRQHGVAIRRSREGTDIVFPSGFKTHLAGDEWREVRDGHA